MILCMLQTLINANKIKDTSRRYSARAELATAPRGSAFAIRLPLSLAKGNLCNV